MPVVLERPVLLYFAAARQPGVCSRQVGLGLWFVGPMQGPPGETAAGLHDVRKARRAVSQHVGKEDTTGATATRRCAVRLRPSNTPEPMASGEAWMSHGAVLGTRHRGTAVTRVFNSGIDPRTPSADVLLLRDREAPLSSAFANLPLRSSQTVGNKRARRPTQLHPRRASAPATALASPSSAP